MSDFELTPDFVLDQTNQYKTLISEFESGVEQRRAKRDDPRRKWKLVYRNRPTADKNTAKSRFDSQKGQYSSFTWTNPNDSTEYTVRFNMDEFKFRYKAYGIYDFELFLIEVL